MLLDWPEISNNNVHVCMKLADERGAIHNAKDEEILQLQVLACKTFASSLVFTCLKVTRYRDVACNTKDTHEQGVMWR